MKNNYFLYGFVSACFLICYIINKKYLKKY